MPTTDTIHTAPEAEQRIEQTLDELYAVFARLDDTALVRDFLGCLFTPVELHDVAKRWLLVKEIDRGTPQREIAKMFNMSLCKITRGSRELKKADSAFRKVLAMLAVEAAEQPE